MNYHLSLQDGDEEVEIEVYVTGGYHPATWGPNGGSPAEYPEIEIVDPKGLPESLIEDAVHQLINEDYASYQADMVDDFDEAYEHYDDPGYDSYGMY